MTWSSWSYKEWVQSHSMTVVPFFSLASFWKAGGDGHVNSCEEGRKKGRKCWAYEFSAVRYGAFLLLRIHRSFKFVVLYEYVHSSVWNYCSTVGRRELPVRRNSRESRAAKKVLCLSLSLCDLCLYLASVRGFKTCWKKACSQRIWLLAKGGQQAVLWYLTKYRKNIFV